MRRLSITNEKVRGIPRRLRALKRWAEDFSGWFPGPEELDVAERYWNWKIPVIRNLVQGRHVKKQNQIECAQRLIDAASHLMAAKPEEAKEFRVTCSICLPEMFSSEVCIYLQEEYFQSHTTEGFEPGNSLFWSKTRKKIKERSIAKEWGLILPEGFSEIGLAVDCKDNYGEWAEEHWYFGEVQPRG